MRLRPSRGGILRNAPPPRPPTASLSAPAGLWSGSVRVRQKSTVLPADENFIGC